MLKLHHFDCLRSWNDQSNYCNLGNSFIGYCLYHIGSVKSLQLQIYRLKTCTFIWKEFWIFKEHLNAFHNRFHQKQTYITIGSAHIGSLPNIFFAYSLMKTFFIVVLKQCRWQSPVQAHELMLLSCYYRLNVFYFNLPSRPLTFVVQFNDLK